MRQDLPRGRTTSRGLSHHEAHLLPHGTGTAPEKGRSEDLLRGAAVDNLGHEEEALQLSKEKQHGVIRTIPHRR